MVGGNLAACISGETTESIVKSLHFSRHLLADFI